ncbi:MAG: type II CAAX endopeptidase family protein [Eubacteriales bacterium]|nr:type II CAAX endopeptidase family protein [Eubacteriales bacterium]
MSGKKKPKKQSAFGSFIAELKTAYYGTVPADRTEASTETAEKQLSHETDDSMPEIRKDIRKERKQERAVSEPLTRQQRIWVFLASLLRAAGPLALYFLMPALTMTLGYIIVHPDMTAQEFFTYGGNFYTALGMCLTIYILHRISRRRGSALFADAGLYPETAGVLKSAGFLLMGICAAVFVSAALTLLPRVGAMKQYSDASQLMFRGRDILFTVLTMVVTGPLAEEIVFRGYMLNGLVETYPPKKAVILCSLLFALCHGELLWILYAFFMGLLLAYVAVREDNIFYSILLHIGFNAPSAVTWLIRSIPEAGAVAFENRFVIAGYGLVACLGFLLLLRTYHDGGFERKKDKAYSTFT